MLSISPCLKKFSLLPFPGKKTGFGALNYFVKNPTLDLKTVNYMINMDMVGRLNEEKSLAIHGVGNES